MAAVIATPSGVAMGVVAQRVGEVQAMHDRLDHPAGHELTQPHEHLVAVVELEPPDHVRGGRPGRIRSPMTASAHRTKPG
jgi:hypothetical protein